MNPQGDRTTFSYDAVGRRTLTELGNATRASYTYADASQVTQLYTLKADDSVIIGLSYEHDWAGNPIGMLESSGDRVTWTYDDTDRLTGEQRSGASGYDTTYTYDPLGNRLVKGASGALTTYAYDSANQLTTSQDASGVTTYTYDLAGNLQVMEKPSGQRTTKNWDDQNRQTEVLLPAGGIITSTYRFDGLRERKADSQGVVKYIWDFNNYLAEATGQNAIEAVHTNEPQEYGNLVSQYRKGPTIWIPCYHHYDGLGSTRVLTDISGNTSDTYLHDAWGNQVTATGSSDNPFRWIGRIGYYWDDALGTFYVRARVYDPITGGFSSWDPVGVLNGPNLYQYAGGVLTLYVDPTGAAILLGFDPYRLSVFCGGYLVFPKWKLTPVDPSTGQPPDVSNFQFFTTKAIVSIQEITERYNIARCGRKPADGDKKCCNTFLGRKNGACRFYEKVTLKAAHLLGRAGVGDQLVEPPVSRPGGCPNTFGNFRVLHKHRVFVIPKVDLPALETQFNLKSVDCAGRSIATSGASLNPPPFWDKVWDKETGTIMVDNFRFQLHVSWDCCKDPPFQELRTTGGQPVTGDTVPPPPDMEIPDEVPFDYLF